MNDKVGLDNLKPEVREAVESIELAYSSEDYDESDIRTIRAELVRLAEENETMERALSKHVLRCAEFLQRTERTESELAALKRRIEESPVVECPLDKPTTEDGWLQVIEWAKGVKWTKGKRVILLLDDGEIPVTPAA